MILVIGTGWYGCHIALELIQRGYEVCMVDKSNTFFAGSSSKNQNRLHLGYHYPRSPETIHECQEGFRRFKQTYPSLRFPIPNNVYCIAESSKTSPLEFANQFQTQPCKVAIPYETHNVVHAMFEVAEEYIDNCKACQFFMDRLKSHFRSLPASAFASVSSILAVLPFHPTWILNCTYNQLDPQPFGEYELYCSLVYKLPCTDLFAFTVMDGPFFSIYPYNPAENLYTVTSVVHGVVWKGKDLSTVPVWTAERERELRNCVESQVLSVLPTFPTSAYESCFLSWKTKPITTEDDRSMRFQREGNYIRVYGGKITGMFTAVDMILEALKS